MSATAQRISLRAPAPVLRARARRGSAGAFIATSLRYLTSVFPAVSRELAAWRRRAAAIPDAELRRLALESLAKRGNMEGAALFAVLAPRARRRAVVRALVAFQAAYNYLDLLAEQPSEDPAGNGRRLHEALLVALDPAVAHRDHYAHRAGDEDGGYLAGLVDATRDALAELPSYGCAAGAARGAAARIVEFQSRNLGLRQGGCEGLERWARSLADADGGLRWWETAAACGSTLSVNALIAHAAWPALDAATVAAIDDAYHPWIGALHSLLDSLVDVEEDRRERLCNLLGHYACSAEARERMALLARRARGRAATLERPELHGTIVTAMVGYYLSASAARAPRSLPITRAVIDADAPATRRATIAFRAARRLSGVVRRQP
ncbi:MAG TPA: DUF2600 family protein [Solirubrobacteraceae bacterium]